MPASLGHLVSECKLQRFDRIYFTNEYTKQLTASGFEYASDYWMYMGAESIGATEHHKWVNVTSSMGECATVDRDALIIRSYALNAGCDYQTC